MITALALVFLGGLLTACLVRLARPDPGRAAAEPPRPEYPESMTAELDPGDEEYLAWLADQLWPEDEYLESEPGDEELR